MSGLLRRSKSTRDTRAKMARDQLDFNFVTEIGLAAATPPEPTTAKPLRLSRRKSVSIFRMAPGVAHVVDSHPKTADPRNRQSKFYGENKTSPPLPVPDRSVSGMSNYGMEADTGLDAECGVIGMAIGSPTEIQKQQSGKQGDGKQENDGAPVVPVQRMYSNDAGTSSTLKLVDRRFEVLVKGPVAKDARKNVLTKERERERDQKNYSQKDELPKTGWRRMFGKGFFSKKSSLKQQQQPEPVTKKLELVTRDGLSPHVVPKEEPKLKKEVQPGPAPCLNVDIPGVEMERYSIMFGTLLNPSEKSTIFARRKSRDIGKKGGTEGQEEPSQLYLTPIKRNASTGQVSRSPASMLEVPVPSSSHIRSPSGLSRSKTTTDASPTLSPQTMYMVNAHSRQEEVNDSSSSITPCSLIRPRPSSKISKISEESSIDTPRGSFDEGDDEWMTKEDDGEPQWEMMAPGGKSPEPMSEAQIETAAQISIARQISISQRQLLIPIVPRSQRLVSRAPIRKVMINPKFPLPPRSEQVQEEEQEQEQEQQENTVPGLAR